MPQVLRPVKRKYSRLTDRNRSFNRVKIWERYRVSVGLEEGPQVCFEVRNENNVGNVDVCIPFEPIAPGTRP